MFGGKGSLWLSKAPRGVACLPTRYRIERCWVRKARAGDPPARRVESVTVAAASFLRRLLRLTSFGFVMALRDME